MGFMMRKIECEIGHKNYKAAHLETFFGLLILLENW
jgi:hypothetical protein